MVISKFGRLKRFSILSRYTQARDLNPEQIVPTRTIFGVATDWKSLKPYNQGNHRS